MTCSIDAPNLSKQRMTDMEDKSHHLTASTQDAVDGFVFKPAGTESWQVWQTINGQHMRIDEAAEGVEPKVNQ
ncbi:MULTISPECIES: hypothetical protein [unclassified Bradyrhizobium]|uniref:hypothetical protein n=1 Tax=unclassified Bradyrhizobium TaxID=2631580 RepID=UPI0015C76AF0|nr:MULTISPECIES: hypothetical protein [unclassified Bradyrhizobium]MBB4259717.1 hypothetical protein [Bradyrhizobium sp. CIR3A]NYG47583.1 hypothetical protein [Bradyrhizobium sp. IAR9]